MGSIPELVCVRPLIDTWNKGQGPIRDVGVDIPLIRLNAATKIVSGGRELIERISEEIDLKEQYEEEVTRLCLSVLLVDHGHPTVAQQAMVGRITELVRDIAYGRERAEFPLISTAVGFGDVRKKLLELEGKQSTLEVVMPELVYVMVDWVMGVNNKLGKDVWTDPGKGREWLSGFVGFEVGEYGYDRVAEWMRHDYNASTQAYDSCRSYSQSTTRRLGEEFKGGSLASVCMDGPAILREVRGLLPHELNGVTESLGILNDMLGLGLGLVREGREPYKVDTRALENSLSRIKCLGVGTEEERGRKERMVERRFEKIFGRIRNLTQIASALEEVEGNVGDALRGQIVGEVVRLATEVAMLVGKRGDPETQSRWLVHDVMNEDEGEAGRFLASINENGEYDLSGRAYPMLTKLGIGPIFKAIEKMPRWAQKVVLTDEMMRAMAPEVVYFLITIAGELEERGLWNDGRLTAMMGGDVVQFAQESGYWLDRSKERGMEQGASYFHRDTEGKLVGNRFAYDRLREGCKGAKWQRLAWQVGLLLGKRRRMTPKKLDRIATWVADLIEELPESNTQTAQTIRMVCDLIG